jgi:predicted alpha/beta superfamily hydrolase
MNVHVFRASKAHIGNFKADSLAEIPTKLAEFALMKKVLKLKALALFAATFLVAAAASRAGAVDGVPAAIPNARQHDLKSRINGLTYRLWISTPYKADPAVAYPVFYVLDGNVGFGTAAEIEAKLTHDHEAAPGIVVGIGYPTDDLAEWGQRRAFDLSPFVNKGPKEALPPGAKTGGGDVFLRVIEEEIKPFVSARYKVDPTKQTLYGYSLSGLLALRVLFRNPQAFSAYILASPSIWYNDREILADEEAFSKRAQAGEFHLRILVTSAGEEQYRGDDPKLLADPRTKVGRMIDSASELADRLAALSPGSITVARTIFEGETHNSGHAASLNRAIRFALPPK